MKTILELFICGLIGLILGLTYLLAKGNLTWIM